MTAARAGIAVALALLVRAPASRAQGLVSPGPLSAAHARYDNITRCLACHDAGRELSGRKCLGCHASIAAAIRADQGYHALATKHGADLACRSCHSEHNGRPYRLVRWPNAQPQERFDHAQVGYPLEGAHAQARCDQCHRPEFVAVAAVRADSSLSVRRTFLGLSATCTTCHLDEHRGATSRQCRDCHDLSAWKPAPRFDHGRTRFPLTGRHADLRCAQCHAERRAVAMAPSGAPDSSYVDFRASRTASRTAAENSCASCHASPHREAGRSGQCEPCHTTRSWFDLPDSARRFDHATIGFPLRGAHAQAPCESCHLASPDDPLPARVALVRANFVRPFARARMQFTRCDQCHADVHGDQLAAATGRDCGACHTETRFAPTRYTLAMHDSTGFPLAGAHQATPCSACHPLLPGARAGSGAIRFRQRDHRCLACHQDPHGGQFAGKLVPGARVVAAGGNGQATTCDGCHDVEAWDRVTFDHDSTRYPLRGAHRRLACGRCHTRPAGQPAAPVRFAGLPTTCAAAGCHEDPHRGQFADRARGGTCTTCHGETAWTTLVFDHQRDTDWPLDGAHRDVRCADCHKPQGTPPFVQYRPLPHRCEDCHTLGPDRRVRT